MAALSASQLEIPNAYRAVAAANDGEQVNIHGSHRSIAPQWSGGGNIATKAPWMTGAAIKLWPPGRHRWSRPPRRPLTVNCTQDLDEETVFTSASGSRNCDRVQICSKGDRISPKRLPVPRNYAVFPRTSNSSHAFAADLDIFHHQHSGHLARAEQHGGAFSGTAITYLWPVQRGIAHLTGGRLPQQTKDRYSFVGLARHGSTGWLDRSGEGAATAW